MHRSRFDRGATGTKAAAILHRQGAAGARRQSERPDHAGKAHRPQRRRGIDLRGATPLALAAEVNNLDAIKVLVDAGADPLFPTESKTTPLMLAAGAGFDVRQARSPKERAIALQTVKFLVERGADVNAAGRVRLDAAARRRLSGT